MPYINRVKSLRPTHGTPKHWLQEGHRSNFSSCRMYTRSGHLRLTVNFVCRLPQLGSATAVAVYSAIGLKDVQDCRWSRRNTHAARARRSYIIYPACRATTAWLIGPLAANQSIRTTMRSGPPQSPARRLRISHRDRMDTAKFMDGTNVCSDRLQTCSSWRRGES